MAVLALATAALAAGITLRRATVPTATLPDFDYWANISGLMTERGAVLDLAALFQHNNEHIVVIPKLLYLANFWLTSGSNLGLVTLSITVGILATLLLQWLAYGLLREMPWRFAACAALIPVLMFSSKLTHSYFMGMSGTIWLTADFFVIAAAAAFGRAVETADSRWLLGSLLASVLGVLAYSTAIYSLIVVLFYALAGLYRPRSAQWPPRSVCAAVIVVSAAALAALFMTRTHPPHHPPLQFDAGRLLRFILIYVGATLPTGDELGPPMVAGALILVAGAAASVRLLRAGATAQALTWLVLLGFAPFNGLMTGIGRLGLGLDGAMSSRYRSVSVLTAVAALVLVAHAWPRAESTRGRGLANLAGIVLVATLALAVASDRTFLKMYTRRNEAKAVAEIALRQGIAGEHHLAAATPRTAEIGGLLPVLRGAGHVPFDRQTDCEHLLGSRLSGGSDGSSGALETAAVYATYGRAERALELSGWAWSAGPAECIVIVDGAGTVIGTGVPVKNRAATAAVGSQSGLAGWSGVAEYPAALPVCAYARFAGDSAWRPLGPCRNSLPDLPAGAPEQANAPEDR